MLKFILSSYNHFLLSIPHSEVIHKESYVKYVSRSTALTILKFGTNIGYDYLDRVRQNQHHHIHRSLYLSISHFLQYIVSSKIYQEQLQLGCEIWYKHWNDLLYYIKQNKHPHAYHSLSLSIYLFFQKWFSHRFISYFKSQSPQILYVPTEG